MASRILSIDLQSDLLSAVLLEEGGTKTLLASTTIIITEQGPAELFHELSKRIDCSDCRCLLSLGCHLFGFRNLSLPFSDRKAIAKVLPFELEEGTAETMESMIIDTIIHPLEGGGAEVICAMISEEVLAKYHTALLDAGMVPEQITLSGLPSVEALMAPGPGGKEFLFLDLHLKGATLFLVSGGRLHLIRPLPFSPFPFAASPSAGFSEDPQDGSLRIEGLEHSGESFRELALTVRQTLAPLPLDGPPEQLPVYLSGTAGVIPEVTPWLEANLGLASPSIIVSDGLDGQPSLMTKGHGPYLNACLSLGKQFSAASSLNFCKGPFSVRGTLTDYGPKLKGVASCLLLALILGTGYLWWDLKSLEEEKAMLLTEITQIFRKTLPHTKRVVDPLQQLRMAIKETQKATASEKGSILPQTVLQVLRALSQRIPRDMEVRLVRMVYEEKGLRIMGLTDSFNTVDSMKTHLLKSPYFGSVTISSTKQNPKDNTIRFELKIGTTAGLQ